MIRAEVLTLFKVPTTDLTIFPVHLSPAEHSNETLGMYQRFPICNHLVESSTQNE